MNEKRPTREAAMEKAKGSQNPICWSEDWNQRVGAAVDAVAALFGGFAPSPVEVPRLKAMKVGNRASIGAEYELTLHDEGLREKLMLTLAARSNAWPQLLKLLENGRFEEAIDLMYRPEMGIGPKQST